jgi:hypothetical protein
MSPHLPQSRAGASIVLAALAAAALAASALAGEPPSKRLSAKTVAERHVLRALGRAWRPSRLPEFVNARTRLPLDNVQVSCRRPRRGPARSSRFVCVVRPGNRRSTVRLYLSYASLRGGGFRIHWLDLLGR